MEAGFDTLLHRDLALVDQYSHPPEIDKETKSDFSAGLTAILEVATANLPTVQTRETILKELPVGEVPEPAKPEVARRAIKGEDTQDVPRVAPLETTTTEPWVEIPRLRIHLFISTNPRLLIDQEAFERAVQLVTLTSALNKRQIEAIKPGIRIQENNLEIYPLAVKTGQNGTSLIRLDPQKPTVDYIEKSWTPLEKSPGLSTVDRELEFRDYAEATKQTKGEIPDTIDLFILAPYSSVYDFINDYNHEYYGLLLSEPYLFFSLDPDWNQRQNFLVFGPDGTQLTKK